MYIAKQQISSSSQAKKYTNPYKLSLVGGLLLTITGTLIIWTQTPASILLAYLIAINLTAFCIMGYDKQAAQNKGARTPELIIGLWALLGGSLGCYLGMRFFRHKTQKARFQFIFAVALAIQVLLICKLPTVFPSIKSAFIKTSESNFHR